MNYKKIFNSFAQVALPTLTVSAQFATSLKFPQWGLIINLAVQPFWLYSGWKAYKQAGQVGILVTTIIMAVVITCGVINYWLL